MVSFDLGELGRLEEKVDFLKWIKGGPAYRLTQIVGRGL